MVYKPGASFFFFLNSHDTQEVPIVYHKRKNLNNDRLLENVMTIEASNYVCEKPVGLFGFFTLCKACSRYTKKSQLKVFYGALSGHHP